MSKQDGVPRLTRREAAAQLGVSKATLDRWRARGVGPAFYRIGGSIRYRAEDLHAFVQRVDVPAGRD